MRKLLFVSLLLLSLIPSYAQDAVMNVRCRQSAAAGQAFQMTFEVNGKASNFKLPSFKNLTVVSGPSTGYSSSTSIINGSVTRSESYTFTILVQASEEGTANVGVASCVVDGKTVNSKPFTIKIDKASANNTQQRQSQGGWGWGQPQSQTQQQQQQAQQPDAKSIDDKVLFAKASINKSNLYQGEEAIIVYKIYTQVPLTQYQIEKLPRNKGFWSEDLSEGMTQVKQYSETYNGRQYQVAEIRRGALFPQETGKLNIAPLKTDVVAIVQTQMQRQRTGTILDFFIDDPFFTPTRQQAVVKSLTSNSINVNVKPLPTPPEGFAGGVGSFSVKAQSDTKELKANEAFTYTVTISGRGNLSLLEAPTVNFPKGMEAYEPRIIDNINKNDNGLSGSRTFEWVVTPQTQGEYEIPSVDYVYFDPSSGSYVTKQINAVRIKVAKGVALVSSKSDVKELNSDIHHIRKSTHLRQAGTESHAGMLYWLLLLLPVVGAGVAVFAARRHQRILGDEESMKLHRATKLAKKRLRNAERHLNDGKDDLFYEEIYKALWGGVADKFNIQLSLLSSDTIRKHLIDKNVDEQLQKRILQTLSDVDFARFAPGDSGSIKQSIYNEAMETIMQISAIKIKKQRGGSSSTLATLLIFVATIFALPNMASAKTNANQEQDLFMQANAAYDSGNYDQAAAVYMTLFNDKWESGELYYNLGNAYYRLDEIGKSILFYERALRLEPNNRQIKDNLKLARSKTVDNIEELPRLFLIDWIQAIVHLTTPRGWRTIIVVLVFLLCSGVAVFFIARNYRLRRAMFVTTLSLLLLTIFSVINATISTRNVTNKDEAVVISPMIVVKGSPDPKSVDKFILHEGTKLHINDRQDDWWQIEIADGKSGWINEGAEII